MRFPRSTRLSLLGPVALLIAGCGKEETCTRCDTVVIAAIGEPATILPPLVDESVGRDIGDQIFERLAVLEPGGAPIDTTAYRPALASAWERLDSLTWRFRLRPDARWQDGRAITSGDVRFSFEAFSDSALGSVSQPYLAGRVEAIPADSLTFLIRFTEPSPEQLYDATYHVRIIPKHVWESVPRASWAADTSTVRLLGSGPFRLERWERGQFLILSADSAGGDRPGIRRAIWRFTTDPDAALNLVLSHEADLLETAIGPERAARAEADSTLRLISYPSAAYGFLGFNLHDRQRRGPHPLLADRETRRGLALGVDRSVLARSVFGEEAKAPPGPMSRLLWIWSDSIRTLPYDTAAASKALDAAGWRLRSGESVRRRGSRRLGFDILVPSTSGARRQLAVQLQEIWRRLGAEVTVTAVDFAVFQERLGQGRFDSYIGAWLDEPTPRGLADQWGRSGWAAINYGRYANPVFDSLLARASREPGVERASALYREAMETLNGDAPAIFLYAPVNHAVVASRVENIDIDAYSWISGLRNWKVGAPR
ncbi:MAG TPA: peptide ABC transporter substrate-binding protein [Gemmatimonadales bacterium]|nr:peptide ABC transporter substrate-binding protein [Gemmatimonadales bacterium]